MSTALATTESAIPAEPPPAFEPTKKMWSYLRAMLEAVESGDVAERSVCRSAKISRATYWEWRQKPGFRQWLGEQVAAATIGNFELAVARHEFLALRGSQKSFEAVIRARALRDRGLAAILAGEAGALGDGAVDARSYTVNVLVQRPDDVASSRIVSNPNLNGGR